MKAGSTVLVLGGYGNFGKRIVEGLLSLSITVGVAGRNLVKAEALCQQFSSRSKATLLPIAVDINEPGLCDVLASFGVNTVIHTSGPFQRQSYHVAKACLEAGCHYVDLADDRRFVCDITSLHQEAQNKSLLLVSGASSVPGLSSVVVDYFLPEFQRLDSIDFAIAPGNKAERGEATVAAILSYTGKAIDVFEQAQWRQRYGWGDSQRRDFNKPVGRRYLANVDVPDLELFVARYPGASSVRFQAGLELPVLHFGMALMAKFVQLKLVKNWQRYSKWITQASRYFERFGTDHGAMQINLRGLDLNGQLRELEWTLTAEDGIGPYIPTISAIILIKKMIAGGIQERGAMPCLGLFSLAEFDREVADLKIYHNTVRRPVNDVSMA